MDVYKKACVLGLGASGESATRLLLSEGVCVTVIDSCDGDILQQKAAVLCAMGVRVCLGCQQVPDESWDVCVVSPGVPITSPLIAYFTNRGVPVISELELGWSRSEGTVLAITGSNGKSTLVKWCAEALQQAGVDARIAGNYGPPLCAEVVQSPEAGCWVLEVSSFQLETIQHFRADVAILLNVLGNHLDRHKDMTEYLQTKCRIFEHTNPADTCIIPYELQDEVNRLLSGRRAWVTFGDTPEATYIFRNHGIYVQNKCVADITGTRYDNPVMGTAAAAAYAALERLHVPTEQVTGALQKLQPLPHRMQIVATDRRGVHYINDSKATNLAAMKAALAMIDGDIRLIAGGLPKQKDFSSVKEILAERVRSVYLIGQAAEDMFAAWHDVVSCIQIKTLNEAVKAASNDADPGETVVLSPGCASFDQFRNYAERGDHFRDAVCQLIELKT